MKKAIFLFGIILLVFVAFGYYKAIPRISEQNNDQGPKIVVKPENWDFGEVKFGEVVEKEFLFRNEGNETLEISRVSTSCGCTKAKVDKEKLEPEEEGKLLVTYDTGAMSGFHAKGKQERIIYIKSNDLENPQVEIIIYADVQ